MTGLRRAMKACDEAIDEPPTFEEFFEEQMDRLLRIPPVTDVFGAFGTIEVTTGTPRRCRTPFSAPLPVDMLRTPDVGSEGMNAPTSMSAAHIVTFVIRPSADTHGSGAASVIEVRDDESARSCSSRRSKPFAPRRRGR